MFRATTLVLALLAATCGLGQAQEGRLKKIAAAKSISIAYRTDATPFSFVDNQQPAGYSIDLCKRVVESIAQQLKVPALKIKWVPVTVQTRFAAVAQGRADMECGSSTVTLTLTRMKQVDFPTTSSSSPPA